MLEEVANEIKSSVSSAGLLRSCSMALTRQEGSVELNGWWYFLSPVTSPGILFIVDQFYDVIILQGSTLQMPYRDCLCR